MKALVYTGPESLDYRDVPDPEAGGNALIRIAHVGSASRSSPRLPNRDGFFRFLATCCVRIAKYNDVDYTMKKYFYMGGGKRIVTQSFDLVKHTAYDLT